MSWQQGEPVYLETQRFIMRSMGPEDMSERMCEWFADPQVMLPMNERPARRTPADLRDELRRHYNRQRWLVGIFARSPTGGGEGPLLGQYKVTHDVWNRSSNSDVCIGEKPWWGRGVVLETRTVLIDFLFDVVGVEKVAGLTFSRNLPAVYNYKALGFTCEGVLRRQRRSISDEAVRLDQVAFGLLPEEWAARRARLRTAANAEGASDAP